MRVAWLRPQPDPADPLDDTAPLIAELRRDYEIEIIHAAGAHNLVWRHAREPFDLFVHELADRAGHAFVPPYAIHFPGVLLLKDFAPDHARAIRAARTVVVGDEAVAASLSEAYPGAHVVSAPVAVGSGIGDRGDGIPDPRSPIPDPRSPGPTVFGLLTGSGDVAERAADRARQSGTALEVLVAEPARVLREADVILALTWPPPPAPPPAALAAMAAGKPVIVFETVVTAAWPALNPQTWQPRGYLPPGPVAPSPPVAVSIDPRDDEHSLMLAMQRLSADAGLRAALGLAGRAWWGAHATPAHAIGAWRRILDAPGLPPSPPFPGADGSEHARTTLAEFGVTVDFL